LQVVCLCRDSRETIHPYYTICIEC